LTDGFKGLITGTKSFGDAFKGVLDTVLDGILQIVIQQALIKPLGGLLGGGSGGGGLLGGLFKSVLGGVAGGLAGGMNPSNFGADASGFSLGGSVSAMDSFTIPSLSGARANGGLTRPGSYLMGERGPEVVRIGATADVTSNRALGSIAANDNRGPTININGPITSNDPDMVRRMVFEGVAQATPMITKQATDNTLAKLQRRNL
jgi:hypothetical protein